MLILVNDLLFPSQSILLVICRDLKVFAVRGTFLRTDCLIFVNKVQIILQTYFRVHPSTFILSKGNKKAISKYH